MHPHIIDNQIDPCYRLWQFGVDVGKQRQKLYLPFAIGDLAPYLSGSDVQSAKQIERTTAFVFMLDSRWAGRLGLVSASRQSKRRKTVMRSMTRSYCGGR